jgi:hypothetical protein
MSPERVMPAAFPVLWPRWRHCVRSVCSVCYAHTFPLKQRICRIWGFLCSDFEECRFLGFGGVWVVVNRRMRQCNQNAGRLPLEGGVTSGDVIAAEASERSRLRSFSLATNVLLPARNKTHISTWDGKTYFKSENAVVTDSIFFPFVSEFFLRSPSVNFVLSFSAPSDVSYHAHCLNTFIRELPYCHG